MTVYSTTRRRLGGLGIAIAAVGLFVVGLAQAQQGNVQQELQLFQNMSPDQQQAILQQLGAGGGGGNGAGSGGLGALLGGGTTSGSGLGGLNSLTGSQASLLQQQLLQQQRQQQSQTEGQNTVPVFKPGDTVLVELAVPAQPANNQATNAPAATQNGTAQAGNAGALPLTAAQLAQLTGQTGSTTQNMQEAPQPRVEELQATERQKLQDLVDLIQIHNPYQLDGNGELLLPGIPPIALDGLTEALATQRVAAEPALAKLTVRLTRLPLTKTGPEALKPFGYDLFENSTLSLLPTLNMPVPADYVIGAGDVLQIQLYGSQNRTYSLSVGRDGYIHFPEIGPIDVGGQRYSDVKNDIEAQVARQMIGVRANVSLGETRTINVFVLGGAKYPGSYTLTGLATVTTALFAAGGVEKTGSLRNIQVKRQGQTIRSLDLYELLMRGDSSGDIKLLPGDVVFIPPVGPTVSLDGQVLRPAIYELKGAETVADLIRMGGGMTPDADRARAALVRIDSQQQRIALDIDPSAPSAATTTLRNGDVVQIERLLPQLDSGVTLQGYVYRPRSFAWHPGMRLSEVIPTIYELKPDADLHYLLIRRETLPDRHIEVLSADLAAALAAPGSAADLVLMPRDTLTAFDLETSREYVIQPLMNELRVQSNLRQPTPIVHIDGRVKVPGDYPLERGMRVSDLIRAGGGLLPSAYTGRAELSRYMVLNGDERRTQVLSIDLNAIRNGDQRADMPLEAFDRLSIKEISGWTEQSEVTLIGEVRFPGIYAIKRGETLRSVIERAGGLTDLAFPQGAVFSRVELKRQEQQQLDQMVQRMRLDIAGMALMTTRAGLIGGESAISIGQTLLSELQSTTAVGRLVINLDAAIHARPGSSNDILLENGDELIVPRQQQEVMVLGEVQDATSHLYHPNLSRDDYINESGGLTDQADRRRIYIVRADGNVLTGNRGWFRAGADVEIHPGDAIVVPLNAEKLPALTLWQSASSIIFNIAFAAAEARAAIP
ncbi:MAG TPA: SLBB domain-containing protein [Steroidobacteraceae bacterium]|nr:SLBB domain-containing protein [Steroidobacteraceae bacterium]